MTNVVRSGRTKFVAFTSYQKQSHQLTQLSIRSSYMAKHRGQNFKKFMRRFKKGQAVDIIHPLPMKRCWGFHAKDD